MFVPGDRAMVKEGTVSYGNDYSNAYVEVITQQYLIGGVQMVMVQVPSFETGFGPARAMLPADSLERL